MLLQNLCEAFNIHGAFKDEQVTHDGLGTNTPPYHHRHWLLKLALVTVQMVLFLFITEDTMSVIWKMNEMWTRQATAHFSALCQSLSDSD